MCHREQGSLCFGEKDSQIKRQTKTLVEKFKEQPSLSFANIVADSGDICL